MKIDFSRYSPQELRDQTEIEFQKCGDAKQAVYNALAFLNNMYGVSDMQKTISLDTQLYKQNDYSKESILKEEQDFEKHFNSNNNYNLSKATQLEIGTKIESEHKDTFKFIKDYRKKHGEYPPEEMVYKQIAKDHLSEFKDYYTRLIAMEKQAEQEMSKAKKDLTKLVKKVIINSKGQQQTVYTKPEGAKTEWLNKFMQFFSFKDSAQANRKLEADYKANSLDKKGVTWQQWKDHVSEYFNNKDKWDRFFNKSTEQKKETAKKEEQKAKKSNKKPKTAVYKLSLMKFIAGMYGKAPEVKPEVKKEEVKEKEKVSNKKETDKDKFVQFIKNQIGINLSNDKNDRLNQKKNYLYTEIPSDRKTMIMSYLNRLGITPEKHTGDNYWIPLNKDLINKIDETIQSQEKYKKQSENNFETMPEGEKEKETPPETPEQKVEDKKIVKAINEATPENRSETEAKVFGEIKQEWAIPFAEYKKSLTEYRNKRVIDELESRIRYYTKELEPERLKQVSGDIENYKKLISARKERYEKTLKEYLNGELNDRLKPEYSWGYMQREYDSIKDKESAEAKSLKRKLTSKENKAKQEHERLIRKAIKEGNIIPANVLKEYPEIQKDDASKMTIPDINYKPIEKEKTVFLGAIEDESTKRNIKIDDYTKVPPKDVYLVDEENILNVPRPSYIPEMDLEDFAGYKGSSQIFDIVRIEPNKYIIVDKRYPVRRVMDRREEYDPRSAYTIYEGKKVTDEERAEYNKRTIEKRNYFEMNAETLAATWDYYRKLYRAKQRQEFEEKQDREEAYYNKQKQKTLEAGKEWKYAPFKRKTIRPKTVSPDSNKMSFSQAFMIQDFTGIKAPVSEFTGPTRMNLDLFMNYQAMLRELDYKINDLRLQRQYDNENSTYKKGQETAYGDSGTKPDLLESKGVLVKRQNGSEIDDQDVGKIGMLLDDLYSVFGDRSSMSKKYGLKISYAGEKRMHASKAVGLFIDKYKCIAVSDFSIEGRGFTVAHEYAHFMDSYIGDQKGYHFSSDQEGSTSNAIASTFRDKLNLKLDPSSRKEAGADYYKRTCECFARAMEQYYAIKQGTENVLYDSYDAKKIGIYVEHAKFMKDIFPLCEKFLTENEELLKAFHKEFDNNKKVFIKKKNPLTGKFEYRKVIK